MSTLQLKVSAERSEILTGENLRITVTAHNIGSESVSVPEPTAGFGFDIVLRDVKEPERGYSLSRAAVRSARYVDDAPGLVEHETVSLAAGATQTYISDLGDLTLNPLRVGEYRLSAGLALGASYLESPPIPLVIRDLHLHAFTAVFSDGGLNEVLTHAESTGNRVIFQKGAEATVPMGEARFRRAEGGGAEFGSETAAAVGPGSSQAEWWYGWRSGDSFSAGIAQIGTIFRTVGPISTGLKHAALCPYGWQPDVEHAYFLAIGSGADGGHPAVSIIKTEAVGKIHAQTIRLAAPDLPAQWAARFDPASGNLLILGVSRSGEVSHVWSQTISIQSAQAGDLKQLATLEGPAVALALSPLGSFDSGTADVLIRFEEDPGPFRHIYTGGHGGGDEWRLIRIPLAGGPPLMKWSVPAPKNAAALKPSGWAIAPDQSPDPQVLAMAGDTVYQFSTGKATWSIVASGAVQPEFLRLLDNAEGTRYAVWVDAINSLQYRAIGKIN